MILIPDSDKLESLCPLTGETLEYHKANAEEIEEAMKNSRKAQNKWGDLSLDRRIDYLSDIRKVIVGDLDCIVDEIKEDTGKVDVEALMTDILPTLDIIKYYEDNAEEILGTEKRKTPRFFRNNSSYVEYKPLGVVVIISPWNFPLQLSMVPAITALIAGNTVLLKPSEITPIVGKLAEEICEEANIPDNVLQVLQGSGDVGEKLIKSNPDKIFFTGSVETGKKIMKSASENLVPLELEMGGKDPMIVFKDSNFDRAVEAAVYGSFANSGQLCVSVERLYVQEGIYEEFLDAVLERTEKLRVGEGKNADLGPMIYPQQIKTVEDHLEDALNKGAEVLTEIKKENLYFYPQILKDVDHSMKIMKEETFGPLLPIMSFKDEEDAIRLANDTKYGLNSSVWSNDIKKAKRVVNKLEVGNSHINDVFKNIGNPHLPFGGAKKSGMGMYHGPEGLKRFSQRTSVMINKNKGMEPNWFPYSEELYETLKKLIYTDYGTIGYLKKIKNYIDLYRRIR